MCEGGREGEADLPCRAVGVIRVHTAWSLKDKLGSSILERRVRRFSKGCAGGTK